MPTPESLTAEVADLRSRTARLTAGLSRTQFNWQPEGSTKWSIGQCFDHLARANTIYLDAIGQAVAAARPAPTNRASAACANRLGRWFIAMVLEPPTRIRARAPQAIQPASDLDIDDTLHRFDESLQRLVALLPSAWAINPSGTRFRNPLAFGLRVFNVTAGFQILTSHGRRHVLQAEQVQARPEWPSS